MPRAELLGFIESAPPGTSFTVRLYGRSMWPLIGSGDTVRVLRCGEDAVETGDIVLLEGSRGDLIAHLLVGTAPVRSAGFLGAIDPPLRLLGRVTEIRRGGVAVRVDRRTRALIRGLHRVASAAYRSAAVREFMKMAALRMPRPARERLLRDWRVRRLVSRDLEEVFRFVGHHLRLSPEVIDRGLRERWQDPGAAVGAFTRGGRLIGFAYLDEYKEEGVPLDGFWIRFLFISPYARGLGVGRALVDALCLAAQERGISEVFADVAVDNVASVSLFERAGFVRAPTELTRTANAIFRGSGRSGDFIIFQKSIPAGTHGGS